MLKVLICASEVWPIIKLGGLGDVIGSLPKFLEKIGVEADVVVPFFPSAKLEGFKCYKSLSFQINYKKENFLVDVWATKLPNSSVDVFLLKNDMFFGDYGKEAFLNNIGETQCFSFFSKCIVELIKSRFNVYDVVHCNDWHTGLVPHLLVEELKSFRPATIMTIHNLSYQGLGDESLIYDVGLNPSSHKTIIWDLSDGNLNLLMQGIMMCDFISTVSPSYAKELVSINDDAQIIQVLKSRKDRLIGILNGLDYSAFPRQITKDNLNDNSWLSIKDDDKISLGKELGIFSGSSYEEELFKKVPVFSMISRLDPNQKGLDILYEIVPQIVEMGGKFVLLGSGDKEWEAKFLSLQERLGRSNVSINIKFDQNLALRIYKGSDFFLIPSKFEPCGLTQMIAMWYGAIPVAHAVGGLKDTISHGKTGFLFMEYSKEAFAKSIEKCFSIYRGDVFFEMAKNCLNQNFSFEKSAQNYKDLYEKAVQIRKDSYGHFYI